MINFNFTVSDQDAENIMGFMNDAICKDHQQIMKFIIKRENAETDKERIDADNWVSYYRNHIKYVEELVTKMGNTRVDDD